MPEGINLVFAARLWKLLLVLLAPSILALIVSLRINRVESSALLGRFESLQPSDFLIVLIPMTPVVKYILANQSELTWLNTIYIISIFTIGTLVCTVMVPALLSVLSSKAVLSCASAGFLFTLFNMPSIALSNNWSGVGSLKIQALVLLVAILLLLFLRAIPKLIYTSVVIAFFIANTIPGFMLLGRSEEVARDLTSSDIIKATAGKTVKNNCDVLLLIYEAYAPYETMLYHGIDNSEQLAYLKKKGFHIYQGVYSIAAPTIDSMSRLFNVDSESSDRKYLAGGGAVPRILKYQGYITYGIFMNDHFLRGVADGNDRYDYSFPTPIWRSALLVRAILAGGFTDELNFEGVSYDSYLDEKHKALREEYAQPIFMYSHSMKPGHRFHLTMNPDDAEKYANIYADNVKQANSEIRQDVDIILDRNPGAIVIIAGDHGPFITKSGYGLGRNSSQYSAGDIDRFDVQDRYGVFLAIRWPQLEVVEKFTIRIFQDIFPAVLAYLFDDEELFNRVKIRPDTTVKRFLTRGVYVQDGILVGGKDDEKPLFNMTYQ